MGVQAKAFIAMHVENQVTKPTTALMIAERAKETKEAKAKEAKEMEAEGLGHLAISAAMKNEKNRNNVSKSKMHAWLKWKLSWQN